MRFLLTILFCYSVAFGQSVYHVSNGGSDGNSGTSALPFATINHALSVAVAGDSILLNRGNVFNEAMTISTSSLKFNAYGTGSNPIITGLYTQTGFTNSGNIWTATASNAISGLNLVILNGSIAHKGRSPNTGWLTFTSYSGDSSITGTLTGNHTGFGIAVRTVPWLIDVTKIVSQTGGALKLSPKLTYTPAYGGNGYFLQDVSLVDTIGEYSYNDTTKLLTVYSATTPIVQISTVDTLVKLNHLTSVFFSNISFSGANKELIYNDSSDNVITANCSLNSSGGNAFNGNTLKSSFSSDSIYNILNSGIQIANGYNFSDSSVVQNCAFKNIGFLEGMSFSGNQTKGLVLWGNKSVAQYNTFESIGYTGINFNGQFQKILNNYFNNFCFVASDGAAIYSAIGTDSTQLANKSDFGTVIRGNVIQNGIGATAGTTNGVLMNSAAGIYLDENVSYVTADLNSIYNPFQSGIFFHNVSNNTATNNNIYGGISYAFVLGGSTSVTKNNAFKHNKIFISDNQGGTYRDYFDNQESIDSNYFSRWPTEGNFMYNQGSLQSLTVWSGATHFDLHSSTTPVDVTYDPVLYYSNPTKSSVTVNIGQTYKDFYGNSANSFTLAPYQSIILFKALNQIIPVVPPNRTIEYLHIRIKSL